jgi:alkaline phosphatase D
MLGVGLISGVRAIADLIAPLFKVSLKDAHKGTLEVDTRLLDSYGRLPENVRSFYLESRKAFAANREADFTEPAIKQAADDHKISLMGGPMLGQLQADGATVWLRSGVSGKMVIRVTKKTGGVAKGFDVSSVTPGVGQRVKLTDLSPNTEYEYTVISVGKSVAKGAFITAPKEEEKKTFRVALGSCFHKIGLHNPNLVREIRKREPHVMMILGDSAVDDRNNEINMHRADYQLRDVSSAWSQLVSNTPVYASWDDHDYFDNDLNGVPKKFTNADRDAVRAVWHQNWNNPPAKDDRKGIYFNTRVGPVEIIMLDTRSCRNNQRRNQYGSYLGEPQMAWLKKTLKSSTAPFKIISSGTMWSDYVSNGKDSWGTWDREAREEVFDWIESEKIGGVLLVSGDRHGARAFTVPRPSGFKFHEFETATLGGVSGPAGLVKDCPDQLYGYDGMDFVAFGEFTFDLAREEPNMTFRLIDQSGGIREEHSRTLRQLTPGQQQLG